MADASVELRAIFKDEVSAAIKQLEANMNSAKLSPKAEDLSQWGKLKESLTDASKEIPGLSTAMNGLGAAMKVVSNPLVAIPGLLAAGAAAGLEFAHANTENITALVRMSEKTGISVNALDALKRQGEFVGIGMDTIGMAVGRLNVQLGKNSTGFKQLGITTKDPLEALAQLADKMKATESASERARIGQQAMGRGYKELLPLLLEGGDAIRKSAQSTVISDGMIQQYESIHHNTVQIGQAWDGIKTLIGDVVAGPLASLLNMAGSLAKEFADAALSWRQMHGEAMDAENTSSVLMGAVNSRRSMGAGHGSVQKANSVDLAKIKSEYAAMGEEGKKAFLAGWNNGGGDALLDQMGKDSQGAKDLRGLMDDLQRAMNLAPKDQGPPAELTDKQKAFLEKQADALANYQAQNAQSQIESDNKYSNDADKAVEKTLERYSREEKALKAHGALLAAMEEAKNHEIDGIRGAYDDKVEAERRKILDDEKNEAQEDAKLQISTAQLKLNDKYIGKDTKDPSTLAAKNSDQSALDKVAMAAEIQEAQGNQAKIDNIKQTYANKELERNQQLADANKKITEDQLAAQKQAQAVYFNAVQQGMESQIMLMEKGKFTQKEFGKVLEQLGEESIARLISETVVSLAQAALTGTAWSGPAMLASIATAGGADVAGTAGFTTAMTTSQIIGHAAGGIDFGNGYIAGEGGRGEMIRPVNPTQITTSSQTTNNVGGHTIIIQGSPSAGLLSQLEAMLTRATGNNTVNRRQMSSNRG